MTDKEARVLILFLTYGNRYRKSHKKFFEICNCLALEKRLIIIKNDSEDNTVRQLNDWTFEIGGDNSVFEFSGWQKGIESEIAHSFKPHVYLIANDSFLATGFSKSFHTLPIVNDEIVRTIYVNKLLAGYVRKIPFKIDYLGLDLSLFIRTHLFLIHSEIIEKLGSIVSERTSEKFVKPEYSSDIFTTSEIWNEQFKKYMYFSLTQRWHDKGKRLTSANYIFFKSKILCYINEYFLSARIRKLNYEIADITPFSKFLNSCYILNIPSRPVVPFQFLRKIIFSLFYILFYNSFSKKAGLANWFTKICALNVKNNLLRQF